MIWVQQSDEEKLIAKTYTTKDRSKSKLRIIMNYGHWKEKEKCEMRSLTIVRRPHFVQYLDSCSTDE